jgi:hypothetical protein
MSDSFYNSRLKIERAKQYIRDLHSRILIFGASDFYGISVDKNTNIGEQTLKIEVRNSLPADIALIIGDAAHNLKSSLDIAINEVIYRRLGHYDDFAKFPMRKTRDDLVAVINGALIKQASEKVTNFIVDVVKPYKGGNDALWALHDLNVLDKHRSLLPVMQVTSITGFCAEDDRGNKWDDVTLVITRNRTVTPFGVQGKLKITNNG